MEKKAKQKIIAVIGPTATGKTALGVALARALGGEVISGDSMQIYRGLPIVTAQPTAEEMQGILHHLIAILPPEEAFSVARYTELAGAAVTEIAARKRIPVLVGGTGLYIDLFLSGNSFPDIGENAELRARLAAEAAEKGEGPLRERLRFVDPESAERVLPNDVKRLIRAWEVYDTTGVSISEWNRRSSAAEPPFDVLRIGIDFTDRALLYNRIDRRVELMLRDGLEKELRALWERRSAVSSTALQGIGVKEFFSYFDGQCTLDAAVMQMQQNSRHYAKRQLTWFRRDKTVRWLFADRFPSFSSLAGTAVGFAREFLHRP